MPRGVPKAGFRKTRKWQERNASAPEPEDAVRASAPAKKKAARKKVPRKQVADKAPVTPPASPPTRETRSNATASKVGASIKSRLDEWAEGGCDTEPAWTEQVGPCEFCKKPSDKVLRITGAKRPKITVRMCRRCLSICSLARLEL